MGRGRNEKAVVLLIVALSTCFSAYGQQMITDPNEVKALEAIHGRLEDGVGYLKNWEKEKDPCTSWPFVHCIQNQTEGFQHVKELRLMNLSLSGTLAPELGQLKHMEILNFMWNSISGSIPKEIGSITALRLLLLSGNQISGPLPEELGYLPNLTKFQLDLNDISGPIPKSFANLPKVAHFHMNNNSISGQIPPELSALPRLQHFLLDNNNLSGYLPPELALMPSLTILQLDNNNFEGSVVPASYSNMSKLLKLSLRNCNLQGTVPDLSTTPGLLYLDLSRNQLTGNIPSNKLSDNITTIILSGNMLNGSIPLNFSVLPSLQKLSLNNNRLSGFVPTNIWENKTFSPDAKLRLNLQRNLLSDISGILDPPPNVDLMLYGNPVCGNANEHQIIKFCKSKDGDEEYGGLNNSRPSCAAQQPCNNNFEHVPALTDGCFCAEPFGVGLRLRSPSISDFPPHYSDFEQWIIKSVELDHHQIHIDSVAWQRGPRLRLFLKFFPPRTNDSRTNDFDRFNDSEIVRIANKFATFNLTGSDIFGPYDLLNFTAMGYSSVLFPPLGGGKSRISSGALVGIVFGSICAAAVLLMAIIFVLRKLRRRSNVSKDQTLAKFPMRIEGVKALGFKELEAATNSFSSTAEIGQGGYGKVYKGMLSEGTIVAIKRAKQGSLQGEKEFYTEIEFLSRLHHRNLVSLLGYCNEGSEQMLVYEFMPNGSLHDLLSARYGEPLGLGARLYIALGAARGILYLHTEADPPIIHRDIKANNILLDSKFTAKVSDFGISRLAPLPDAETSGGVTTVVKGTPGYLDPEYVLNHKLTEKSDVYSLGVVFLELLTGMRPISHGRNIVREVNAACQSGMMSSIIDRSIGPYSLDCVKKFVDLALRCSLEEQKDRPLMLEVVRELENITYMLPAAFDNNIAPDLDVSTSGMSSSSPTSAYSRHTTYTTMEGIELVSGVIPSVRPR
ncbi:probable LRR receptor-like serine/threonine-protein kinase At1g06840 isoform X2 [Lycium ferocissimum]|uniref:probable LRR receptor-like serine/threonine-protein kinase At1g06840 isoform X2 n=1 Tax=Lycium ferocissimum TaxID=112874 RepID=UPI002814FF42|nr:probable LRR receptor-like serine/threonine-protein kinase At1g06840 isoform X2 [Lycium ferocissimum]